MARNLALARSGGAIIVNLDADDQFTPGALGRIVDALIDPDTGWTTSALIDLLPDGSQRRFDGDPPAGRLYRGSVTRYWQAHDWALQVHPSTLAARRELLVAAGGWLGVPVSEDMGLLVALDQITHGAFISEPGIVRRVHAEQLTQRPEHQDLVARLRGLVWERAAALNLLTRTDTGGQGIPPVPEPVVPVDPPRVSSAPPAAVPAELAGVAQWPIRIVLALTLLHLGVCIGILVATPDKWAEALAVLAISLVVYVSFGWLAIVVRNRIRADTAPVQR